MTFRNISDSSATLEQMHNLLRVLALLAPVVVLGCQEPTSKKAPIDDDESAASKKKSCPAVPAEIDDELTIPANCSLDIDHTVIVTKGGRLLIEPGVRLTFAQHTILVVTP